MSRSRNVSVSSSRSEVIVSLLSLAGWTATARDRNAAQGPRVPLPSHVTHVTFSWPLSDLQRPSQWSLVDLQLTSGVTLSDPTNQWPWDGKSAVLHLISQWPSDDLELTYIWCHWDIPSSTQEHQTSWMTCSDLSVSQTFLQQKSKLEAVVWFFVFLTKILCCAIKRTKHFIHCFNFVLSETEMHKMPSHCTQWRWVQIVEEKRLFYLSPRKSSIVNTSLLYRWVPLNSKN